MTPHVSIHQAFSPKRLALALGVSESSIKRWIDSGLISVSKTAGGHRRVPLYAVIRFVREQGMEVVQPELLGLPGSGPTTSVEPGHLTADHLFDALTSAKAESALGLIVHAFVSGAALHDLFDGPVREAMDRIGTQWHVSPKGIATEHRSTQVIIQTIGQLRGLLPPAADDAPVAIGCAPSSDVYLVPSLMADVVLASAGFREINLGPDTPIEALLPVVEEVGPAIVWLSISVLMPDPRAILAGIEQIRHISPRTHVLYGGRAAGVVEPGTDPYVRYLRSMADLAGAAGQIFAGRSIGRTGHGNGRR